MTMTTQVSSEELQEESPSILSVFLNEQQDPKMVKRVHARVQEILTSDETILYIAVQKKPIVTLTPDCVVLTNRRFIIYRPKMLGRVSFEDYIWRDLRDARLKEGMIGATLTMQTVQGKGLRLEYLPKAQARRLYSFAQEMEEKVREERRRRDLEEKRAAAGGVVLQTGAPTAQARAPSWQDDPVEKLKKLKEMADMELITAGEYEAKRAEIISQM